MKTSSEIELELATLNSEAQACLSLVNSIPALRVLAQRATTDSIIGRATVAEVNIAQSNLEQAVAALSRKDALARAIAETNDALIFMRGRERQAFCESIAASYQTTYDNYLEQCRHVLATYKQLGQISTQYSGMTGRALLDQYQADLHLPALHGPDDWSRANMPTGRR